MLIFLSLIALLAPLAAVLAAWWPAAGIPAGTAVLLAFYVGLAVFL